MYTFKIMLTYHLGGESAFVKCCRLHSYKYLVLSIKVAKYNVINM